MKSALETNINKIIDPDLRLFLETDSHEKIWVLLEIKAPELAIDYHRDGQGKPLSLTPAVVNFSSEEENAEDQAVAEARSLLETMNVECRFLKSARAFIVEVTSEQLRTLIAAPTIQAAMPNRRFPVPR